MIQYLPLSFILFWSSAFVSGQFIVQSASPFASLTFRFFIVGICFLLFSFYFKEKIIVKTNLAIQACITGILFHGFYLGGVFFSYSIGKSNYKIGDGYRSIIFSDSTPSFPNFNFTWNFYRNLDFSYMHGILSSSIYDERTNEELYSSFNKDQYDRHVVYHKINYRIDWIKDLDLSICIRYPVK